MKNPFKKKHINTLVPVLAGVAIGGVIALLLAPDNGEGTRSSLVDTAKKGWDAIKDNISLSEDDINSLKDKAVAAVKSFSKSAENLTETVLNA